MGFNKSGCPFYNGPEYTVLDPSYRLECVERFELLIRNDSGRDWNSLGTFPGNADHLGLSYVDLTSFGEGGVTTRFLRLRPLLAREGGSNKHTPWAMRVGVHGTSLSRPDSSAENGLTVAYKIKQTPSDVNRKYCLHEFNKDGRWKGPRVSCRARLDHEIKLDLAGTQQEDSDDFWDESEDESDSQ